MDETPSGRPRRTRQSTRQTAISTSTSSTPATPPANKNPYKRPTYLASKERANAKDDKKCNATVASTPRGGRRSRGRPPGSGSRGGTSVRGRNVRPECVATRVDKKRTSICNNSTKKKRRGGYNSHDYHYGSDFDSDDNESEHDDHPGSSSESDSAEDNTILEEVVESDSDSFTSSRALRLPSPPVPMWLEPDNNIEELEIPRSSDDLLLQREYVVKAVSIYEPLRRFHQLVRLTPFRFEDFCAALATEEQSALLAEIHIQLLKTILREDDNNGTVYGPNEVKDSVQSILFFVDNLTWADSLRAYIESDIRWCDLLKAIASVDYPFCGPELRIKILSWLVDLLLTTNAVRESLLSEGSILHEDHCRSCNRLGELICCETCPAVYHLGCIDPPIREDEDPPDDWKCAICKKHKLTGVMDCTSELEKAGLLIRHEKLGHDRHGRKYWFLTRRILVESDDGNEVWYYTTPLQVEELLHRLDEDHYEVELVEAIKNQKEEIYAHMAITEKVTNSQNNLHRKTYLDAENAFLKKIHADREALKIQENEERERAEEEARLQKQKEEDEKARVEEELKIKAEAEKKRKREERLARRNKNKFYNPNEKEYEDSLDCDMPLTPDDSSSCIDGSHPDENFDENSVSTMEVDEEDIKPASEPEVKEEINNEEGSKTVIVKDNGYGEPNNSKIKEDKVEPLNECKMEVVPSDEPPIIKPQTETVDSPKKCEDVDLLKDETSSPVEKLDCKIVTRSKTGSLTPKISADGDNDSTTGSRRKSKALYLDVDSEERVTRLKSTGLYKLAQEGGFRTYVNHYSHDALALSKSQHNEERDRRRHMSHKFSLTLASECKWSGGQQGFRSTLVGTLRATLLHMETALPGTVMHINWPMLRKAWITAVSACVTSRDFSKAMIALAACIRPVVFNPCWSENTGHVKLIRISALEREERKKAEKRDKKDRDDEEDRLRLLPQFVKYSIPPKHQIFKQKGEEYRVHGRWGWLWMSTLRPNKPKDARKLGLLNGPNKHVIQVKNESGKVKTMLIDPIVFDKLMAKRSLSLGQKQTAITNSTAKSEEETPISCAKEESMTNADESSITPMSPKKEQQSPEKMDTCSSKTVPERDCKKSESVTSENSKPDASNNVEHYIEPVTAEVGESDATKIFPPDSKNVTPGSQETLESATAEIGKTAASGNCDQAASKNTETVISENADFSTAEHNKTVASKGAETVGLETGDPETKFKSEFDKDCMHTNDKPSSQDQGCVAVKEESNKDSEKGADISEKVATDEKPSTEELARHDMTSIGRKFKTELVNVSLGIVSANRILYPKIAHRIPILDNLLSRRLKWQSLEEKEYIAKYGAEAMKKVKEHVANRKNETGKKSEDLPEEEKLDENFPQAGIYTYQCYSNTCRKEASKTKPGAKKLFEGSCYSPMCRLKYCLFEAQREKKNKSSNEKQKSFETLVKEIEDKRMYTQSSSCSKIYLKKLPDQLKKKRNQVKYPLTSGFRSIGSKKPSILIAPQYELKKLARTGGRSILPTGFTSAPKAGSWAWPYPCGRSFFKTSWQYRTVHSTSLASAAMQLRILYASIRWDDIQTKPPNSDGKNQITTDMEIVTTEILNHRIVGRFMERVQYLRKKQIIPIDAPKTIRDVTPSRSGLRKRKRVESPEKSDPIVTEEWVEEDKVDLWEIKFYGDKLDKKVERKPDTPSTRMKTGVVLKHPDKYDPSTPPSTSSPATVSATKTAELMKEHLETELKMQRAVHLSKRDNHAKINNTNTSAVKTPTASQQLQQQNAAAGLPANHRSYTAVGVASTANVANGGVNAKKNIVIKGKPVGGPLEPPQPNPVILNRKCPVATKPLPPPPTPPTPTPPAIASVRTPTPVNVNPPPISQLSVHPPAVNPPQVNQVPAQRLTVYRSADGKLNVKGLLPGQQCYQTSDGKIHVTAAPLQAQPQQIPRPIAPPVATAGALIASSQQQQRLTVQPTQVTNTLQQSQIQSQNASAGGNIDNPLAVTSSLAPAPPLINISNPTYKSNINPQPIPPQMSSIKSPLPIQQPPQQMVTYSTPKSSKKVKLGPQPTTTSINFSSPVAQNTVTAGSLVFTTAKNPQIIRSPQINQQGGQYVITSQTCQIQGQPTIALSSAGNIITTSGVNTKPLVATAMQTKASQQITVASQQTGTNLASINIPGITGTGNRILVNDGTKTMVINAGALTQQQLQHLASQIHSKKVVVKPQPVAVQPQQQTVQIIQQSPSGLPIQVIQQQQPHIHGQQPQYVITTGGGTFHQVATIGGQQVIVKKVFKSPSVSDRSMAGSMISTRLPSPVTLMSPNVTPAKSVIKVGEPGSPAIFRQPMAETAQSQLTPTSTQVSMNIMPRNPMIHPGVTRAQGLPISIVSPSKAKLVQMPISLPMVPANITPAPTITVSATSIGPSSKAVASVIQKSVPKVIATPSKVQHQVPLQNIVSTSKSPVFPGGSPPPIQNQPISAACSSILNPTKPPIQVRTLTSSPAPNSNTQNNSPIQREHSHFPQSNSTLSASPTKLGTPQKPQKIVAQIFQTPTGPKVVIQGVQPGELTPAQMAQLQQQISKQLSSNIGGLVSPSRPTEQSNQPAAAPVIESKPVNEPVRKIVDESHNVVAVKNSAPLPATLPVIPVSSPVKSIPQKISSPSPANRAVGTLDGVIDAVARPELASTPIQHPVRPVTFQAQQKSFGTTTPSAKPPPIIASSESLMEAIEAVASATSTLVPTPKVSPRKSQPKSSNKGSAKDEKQKPTFPKILQTPDGEVVAKKSSPFPISPSNDTPPPVNELSVKLTTKSKSSLPKTDQLIVAVKSAPPPIVSPPPSCDANSTPAPVDGPRFILSQDLPNPVPNPDISSISSVVPCTVTPSTTHVVNQEPSVSPNGIASPLVGKSIQYAQPQRQQESQHNQSEPTLKTPCKKRSPKTESTVKPVAITPNAANKLSSALFRQKELLKKDIFKKRGLLEKELTIDIQREISEEITKSKKVNTSNTQELNAIQKTSHKRKANESKSSTVATSMPSKNDSHRSGPPYPRNTRGPTPPKKRRKGNKLYCICKTPYDNSKFYVGCDVCSNWYHGDCIGITEEMSGCLSEYVCDACQVDSKKLYCLCRQPYDESQFYICCDTCQDWFHGRCVGILQAEANDIEEYICPNCDSSTPLNNANLKPLSYEDYPLLSKLLKQIQTHKSSWPFLEPVDQSEAPNYYRVIKEPMDLQTVEFRVDEKCYSRLRDFIGDVTKIFDNCRYYNPQESTFYKSAESLEAFFAQKIALLRQRLS